MDSDILFREFLIVSDTKALAHQVSTGITYTAMLDRGTKFRAVTNVDEQKGLTYFTEVATGMYWAMPSDVLFELTGRFAPRDTNLN